MPDQSFKCWHIAVNCDHPAHRKADPSSNDWEQVEPGATKDSYRDDLRAYGWIFHRDGRVTCPQCAGTKIGDRT